MAANEKRETSSEDLHRYLTAVIALFLDEVPDGFTVPKNTLTKGTRKIWNQMSKRGLKDQQTVKIKIGKNDREFILPGPVERRCIKLFMRHAEHVMRSANKSELDWKTFEAAWNHVQKMAERAVRAASQTSAFDGGFCSDSITE